jgi:chromosome segregation ATPase
VIQATLIFILGFLSAVFLAVLVAPAIWRRAVAFTQRRIEATLPLSLNEIQAGKDAVRAEYAMEVRKLEVTTKALRERLAAQSLDVDRARDEIRRFAGERDEKLAMIAELEARQGALRAEIVRGEKETIRLGEAISERDRLIDERAREIDKLGAMYDEASFNASNRQIEMVAQEANLEKLADELEAARQDQARLQALLETADARTDELDKALRSEKRRIVTLERNVEKLTASLSDRDEKLERRERDLERLRAKLRSAGDSGQDMAARLAAEQDKAVRLRDELAMQTREIKALRAVKNMKLPAAGEGEQIEAALLRERINELAAEVISLTARLEGPDSEIGKLLAAAPASAAKRKGEGDLPSLADRVRALQQANPGKN